MSRLAVWLCLVALGPALWCVWHAPSALGQWLAGFAASACLAVVMGAIVDAGMDDHDRG